MANLGSFSYIERDYQDILSAVVERIPKITTEWTDWNQSDIGIAILQLVTGMIEMLAYTEDQHANQLTVPTCTQRGPMINLTKSLAYTMANYTAASVDLLLSRTPYTATSSSTTLNETISAQSSVLKVTATGYVTGDVLYLSSGTTNEYVVIDYITVSGGVSTITIKGVTRYGYAAGATVGYISNNKNVVVLDNLECTTTSTEPVRFEAAVASAGMYTIYAGSTYVNQTTVLGYSAVNKTLSVLCAYDLSAGDTIFLKSSIFSGNSITLTVASVSSRVITVSEALPSWIQVGDALGVLVPATHGITRVETVTASTGLPSQYRDLTYTPVITDSLVVEVNEGSGYVTWTAVDSFFSSDSNDTHYTVEILSTDKARITFGDNINGQIPALNASIRITYVQGGGTEGNVGKNMITRIADSVLDVGGSTVSLTVNNPNQASGGADKESLDVARVRAPALYATTYRALSATDFEALASGFRDLTYGTVAKAKVTESLIANAVSVYVWAADANGFATSTSSGLKSALKTYLEERAAEGYLVSIVDGATTSVDITGTLYLSSGATRSVVRTTALAAINNLFQIENLTPGEDFYLGNLYEALEELAGVSRVDIVSPVRPGVTISNLHVAIRGSVNLTLVGGN